MEVGGGGAGGGGARSRAHFAPTQSSVLMIQYNQQHPRGEAYWKKSRVNENINFLKNEFVGIFSITVGGGCNKCQCKNAPLSRVCVTLVHILTYI